MSEHTNNNNEYHIHTESFYTQIYRMIADIKMIAAINPRVTVSIYKIIAQTNKGTARVKIMTACPQKVTINIYQIKSNKAM